MRLLIFIIISSIFFASCQPQRALYNYLEDLNDTTSQKPYFISEPVIQKNDLLSVQISSASLNPLVDQDYNIINQIVGGIQTTQTLGYLVDQKGNIELPRLGIIPAAGFTRIELTQSIKDKLKDQLTNPTVIIRFLNFRIIVIGEVGAPGVHSVPVENLTLLEALAMAGDITEFGKKKEVKILREESGKRKLGIVDVTTTKMFESPYYQLQQNDVIFVEQTKYKIRQTEQGRIIQQIGFATSIISTAAILITLLNR
jgi:polysaccharide export outer membrane protein